MKKLSLTEKYMYARGEQCKVFFALLCDYLVIAENQVVNQKGLNMRHEFTYYGDRGYTDDHNGHIMLLKNYASRIGQGEAWWINIRTDKVVLKTTCFGGDSHYNVIPELRAALKAQALQL